MRTRCPQCNTVFNITQQQLNLADGHVRCSQCQAVFDGYIGMTEDDNDLEPPELDEIVSSNGDKGNKVDIDPNRPSTPHSLIYPELLEDDYNIPLWRRALRKIFWTTACLLLLALLLLQYAYYQRAELVEHPQIGRYISQACDLATPYCSIPIKRSLTELQLESRHVYSHPNVAGALVVSATFSNQAKFNQPYPLLVVSMSNIRGQEVAARQFQPEEYLPAETDIEAGMPPGGSASFSLEIQDPGEEAMAFELDFL